MIIIHACCPPGSAPEGDQAVRVTRDGRQHQARDEKS